MGGLLFYVALGAFYAAIAFAWFVAPIVSRFSTTLVGTAQYAPDAVLNAGVLEWVYGALRSPTLHVFDWTAAFPLKNSLAVTENLIGWQIFYFPLRLLGLGIVSSYNVVLLLSFVISGLAAAALCRRLGASRSGAVIGGFMFAFVPFHVTHSIHLQTMGVCWTPLALLFLDRLLEKGEWKDAAGLAAACVLTALSSIYFAVFLAIAVVLWIVCSWIFARYAPSASVLSRIAVAGAVSLVTVSPVLMHYVQFVADNGRFSHPSALISVLSMELAGVIRIARWQALSPMGPFEPNPNNAPAAACTTGFPGLIAVVLTLYWLVRIRRKEEDRRLGAVLLSVAIVCFVLALGPYLKVRGSVPSPAMHWLPMPGRIWLVFSTIRWPMRLYFLTILMMSVMVSLGATSFLARLQVSRRRLVTVVIIAVMVLEYMPRPAFAEWSVGVADPILLSDAYRFLADEADRGAIAELPLADRGGRRAPAMTRYTYGSIGHLRRVVAVHGSIIPPVTDSLETALEDLPDAEAQNFLSSHGITRLVIHKPMFKRDSAQKLINALKADGLPVVFDGHEGVVFSLTGSRQVH